MLSNAELEALARDLESDRVERKSSFSGAAADKVAQAVCAFANDLPGHAAPGVVFIGLDDTGAPTGTPITDRLLLDLAALRSDGNILPFPEITVSKRSVGGAELAVVEVLPAQDPPVRYQGRVWVRIGPRRATATADEERRLREKRQSGHLAFDQRGVPGSGLDDLDLERFRWEYLPKAVAAEVLAENGRSIGAQLAALHLLDRQGLPNAAALLLYGHDPRRFVPGAWLQFVRFAGRELSDPIRNGKELSGILPDILRRADDLIEAHVETAIRIEGEAVERRFADYPVEALRQFVHNAVLHRDYETTHAPVRIHWFDDRIEMESPGGPFGRVSAENFGQGVTDYRNPTLAEGLRTLGFIQRFGVGLSIARSALARNGNPPARFEISPSGVRVIVYRAPSSGHRDERYLPA